MVKNGFTDKMETIELCADVNEMNRLKDDKINTIQGDLNFVELPTNTYDFILCHGILHHLINLEHILYQINKSLKPNGLFLVYEYIGETIFLYGGFYFPFLVCTNPREDIHIKNVINIDEKVSKDGILPPCYHMGLYRKNDNPEITAIKWSNNFLRLQLAPKTPIWYKFLISLKRTVLWSILRTIKRRVLEK